MRSFNSTVSVAALLAILLIGSSRQMFGGMKLPLDTNSAAMSGCTLYTTFEPCAMCGGALMVSGIVTLVMGARPESGDTRYGAYTVERLFELSGWERKMEVVTGILVPECHQVRREWEK